MTRHKDEIFREKRGRTDSSDSGLLNSPNQADPADPADGSGKIDENSRVFTVSKDYDIGLLADALVEWMNAHLELSARRLFPNDGCLVQADDTEGLLGRMVQRRAESLYVKMVLRADELHVRIGREKPKTDPPVKAGTRGSGLWNKAAAAFDAGIDLAGAAVSTVSGLLMERETAEKIFHFISERTVSDIDGGKRVQDDVETARKLAALQPLVETLLARLVSVSDGDLKRRASDLLALLSGDGFDAAEMAKPVIPRLAARPVGPELIEHGLRHPAAREGTVLRKIGNFLAAGDPPDAKALKSYARRITPETSPELSRALVDGALILGMPAAEGYISFGDLDTGIRGYNGKPPFFLIGGSHLDPSSPASMTAKELRFLVGGEMAHIRFGHERITSREVWEGTFDKALSLAELVPVLGTYLGRVGRLGGVAGRATDMARKVGNLQNYIRQAKDVAATTQNVLGGKGKDAGKTDRRGLSHDEQNLISAFRVMQLSADRAGLLLCGDACAAVTAIFKSRPDLMPELPAAKSLGLSEFLGRVDGKGEPMFQNLAVRLTALFSFYLSSDYESLESAAYGHPPLPSDHS